MNSTKKLFGRKKGSVIKIRVWRAPKIRDLRKRLLVGITILLKYSIMKFSRNVQPCKVWDEADQKYLKQYEIVFAIMIVLGKKNEALTMLDKLKDFLTPILASAMFIAIGLGLLELIREVTEPEKAPIRKRVPS